VSERAKRCAFSQHLKVPSVSDVMTLDGKLFQTSDEQGPVTNRVTSRLLNELYCWSTCITWLLHEHGTLCRNWFRMRLLFLSSDGNWRLCCSSRPFRLTDNMFRELSTSDELSPAWLLTLTESDCTVVLQQKCDNATLIILISTTTNMPRGITWWWKQHVCLRVTLYRRWRTTRRCRCRCHARVKWQEAVLLTRRRYYRGRFLLRLRHRSVLSLDFTHSVTPCPLTYLLTAPLFLFCFHSVLRWSVAVSTMRRQSSVLQADARPMFCSPSSDSTARSRVCHFSQTYCADLLTYYPVLSRVIIEALRG